MTKDFLKGCVLTLTFVFFNTPFVSVAEESEFTGEQIIKRCSIKNPGKDQYSKFEVRLRDNRGNVKHSIYTRLWKDYQGNDDITDKMLLFTEFPPGAKGSAFMRVSYVREANKKADQWIYLPVLRKIRRVTIRDQGDSFLNSELTYADVNPRTIDEDEHKLLSVKKVGDLEFYVVESTPREASPLYGKRVLWFSKTADWKDCANIRIDYYDPKGDLLKEQFIKWQQINDAWIWDRVLVRNIQTVRASIFLNSDVQTNIGIDDSVFSERSLTAGSVAVLKSIPGIIQGANKKPTEKKQGSNNR